MGRTVVRLLNSLTRLRRKRCGARGILVLIPSCLQSSECTQKITNDVAECRRCGRCKVKDIVELCEMRGVRCAVATGGRLALQMARDNEVEVVVAVACEKELQAGLLALLPKAGFGIINLRPNGPCKDTDVDVAEVEAAVSRLLGD